MPYVFSNLGDLGAWTTSTAPRTAMTPQQYAVALLQRWINSRAFGPGSGRAPIAVNGIWDDQTQWGMGLAAGSLDQAAIRASAGITEEQQDLAEGARNVYKLRKNGYTSGMYVRGGQQVLLADARTGSVQRYRLPYGRWWGLGAAYDVRFTPDLIDATGRLTRWPSSPHPEMYRGAAGLMWSLPGASVSASEYGMYYVKGVGVGTLVSWTP